MDITSTIRKNRLKTYLLFAGFLLFVAGIIALFLYLFTGGINPVILAGSMVVVGIAMVGYYFLASKVALSLNHAQEVDAQSAPELYALVQSVVQQMDMPMPRVYIMPNEPELNAFATGRNVNNGHICFTAGILNRLNREELEGVVAHELSHVKNEDIKIMTLAAGLAAVLGVIVSIGSHALFFSDRRNMNPLVLMVVMIALSVTAPLAAALIQTSISRKREALADATAAHYTQNPRGLASALHSISNQGSMVTSAKESTAHLFFSNPFRGNRGMLLKKMFSTHPPIEERIDALNRMR